MTSNILWNLQFLKPSFLEKIGLLLLRTIFISYTFYPLNRLSDLFGLKGYQILYLNLTKGFKFLIYK